MSKKSETVVAINAVSAESLRASLNANVAARIAYERDAHSNEQIVDKFIKYLRLDRKSLETTLSDAFFARVADVRFVESYDFMNNHVKANQRFNVYAVEKVQAKIACVSANKLINATSLANKFCVAAVLTCLQHRDKDSFAFTRQHALSMLSRAFRFEHVSRSDFAQSFNVTESTASTQVSSSFRALEALRVLKFDDSQRDRSVVSEVNYDNDFVRIVRDHFKIA